MHISGCARILKSPFCTATYSVQSSIIREEHELAFCTLRTAPFCIQMLYNRGHLLSRSQSQFKVRVVFFLSDWMVISNANVRERTFKRRCRGTHLLIWWHGAYMKLYQKKIWGAEVLTCCIISWMVSSIGKSWSLIFPEWLGGRADNILASLDGASIRPPVFDAILLSVCDSKGEKSAPFLRFAAILPANDALDKFRKSMMSLWHISTNLTVCAIVSIQLHLPCTYFILWLWSVLD